MQLQVVDDKEKVSESIITQIPIADREMETERILSRFAIEEKVVKDYENAKSWEHKIGDKPKLALVGWYFLFIISFAIFSEYIGRNPENIPYFFDFFILGVVIISIVFIIKIVFSRIANKKLVDHDEAIYHRLSRSIREFQNENYESSISELEKIEKLMKYQGSNPFSPEFTKELGMYINEIDTEDSVENYKNTFPEAANKILHALVSVYTADLEYVYPEESSVEQVSGDDPTEMLVSYIIDVGKNKTVRVVGPYVILAPIVYAIYLVNQDWATIAAIISVAIIQTYNRPE